MWHAERHVSDVTLVEIWKTRGWKANDFLSSVRKKGLWDLFLMKTSGHMIWNIRMVFLMLSDAMSAWVHVVLHQDTKHCFEHHLLNCSDEWIFVSWSHRINAFCYCSHRFWKYILNVLKPCFPDLQNEDVNIFKCMKQTTHSNPQMLDFLFYWT